MTMLRWGVLGAASIARRKVIPAIQASHNGQLVAIASRSPDRAHEVVHMLGSDGANVEVFDSYAELLASPNVDAVYIPLPNSEHRPWTIAAAEAGKHILCEKPLALSTVEAEEMVAAAERAGVRLMEAFMYRHHPIVTKVLELLHANAIGELRLVRSTFSFMITNADDIRLDPQLGGGALMDVGCYGINLARLVTVAEPVDVGAVATVGSSGVDESFAGVMRFPSGTLAQFDVSFRAGGGPSYELIGTSGKLVVRQGFKPEADEEGEIQIRHGNEVSRIFTESVDQYQLMVEDFAKSVLGKRPFAYPAQDAVANMRALDALRDAAERS